MGQHKLSNWLDACRKPQQMAKSIHQSALQCFILNSASWAIRHILGVFMSFIEESIIFLWKQMVRNYRWAKVHEGYSPMNRVNWCGRICYFESFEWFKTETEAFMSWYSVTGFVARKLLDNILMLWFSIVIYTMFHSIYFFLWFNN